VQYECKRFTSDLPTLDNIMGTSRGLVFCARRAMVQIGRKTMAEILREVEKRTMDDKPADCREADFKDDARLAE
jgi:hypothetical protein